MDFLYFSIKYKAKTNPNPSATGTAIHIPMPPAKIGITIIARLKNKNVLANDIIAECLPSERAVKRLLAKIVNPQNKNPKAKIQKPSIVILKVFDPSSVKNIRLGFIRIKDNINMDIATIAINIIEILNIIFF